MGTLPESKGSLLVYSQSGKAPEMSRFCLNLSCQTLGSVEVMSLVGLNLCYEIFQIQIKVTFFLY